MYHQFLFERAGSLSCFIYVNGIIPSQRHTEIKMFCWHIKMNKLWFFRFRRLWVLKEKSVICHLPGENEVADWDQTEHRSAFNGGHHCFF